MSSKSLAKLRHKFPKWTKAGSTDRPVPQVGAICTRMRQGKREVLLITSRDTGRWVIPKGWPMKGKTGAVRLALMTGAPLLPTAVWGTQRLFGLHSRKFPLFPRTRVMMAVGAPVDISDLLDRADNADALREGTARLMTAITDLLAGLRGERPPASASVQQ